MKSEIGDGEGKMIENFGEIKKKRKSEKGCVNGWGWRIGGWRMVIGECEEISLRV